jgi:hypothetical protein
MLFKDEVLEKVAREGNIAQFLSFDPELRLRLWNVRDFEPKEDLIGLLNDLIEKSSDKSVNIRSFKPEQPKGFRLEYGKTNAEEVLGLLKEKAASGLYTIVNETIDVDDGGVSGVVLGDVIEFTPHDTPKGVDKEGVCSLPRTVGLNMLENVYGFRPALDYDRNLRVEFSIHPIRRGIRNEQTIIWEIESFDNPTTHSTTNWPNNFSTHLGDKVFGLLLAHHSGLLVPLTTAICRSVAPFTFGTPTGLAESWIRTAPRTRTPGKFSTFFGWKDPFKLLAEEDPGQDLIASVISQRSVDFLYSGSLLTQKGAKPYIEGTTGRGDEFMLGKEIGELPANVVDAVSKVFEKAYGKFGPVEMEWVFDGKKVWIVQLHRSQENEGDLTVIVPGEASEFVDFAVKDGLESLRSLISDLSRTGKGIRLVGNVGITSHYGDVLRKSGIPSVKIQG